MDTKTLFSSSKSGWETPDWLFDELNEEFNFVWDAAADKNNSKCVRWIGEDVDSLSFPWVTVPLAHDGAWWLNPPYGREIAKWVRKAWREAQDGLTVVVLCAARTDTEWWHNYAMKADEIRLIRGRLRFKGADSVAPFPSAILIFKPLNVSGLRLKWSVIDARGRR